MQNNRHFFIFLLYVIVIIIIIIAALTQWISSIIFCHGSYKLEERKIRNIFRFTMFMAVDRLISLELLTVFLSYHILQTCVDDKEIRKKS